MSNKQHLSPSRRKIDVATKSEVAAQILPSLGPRENAEKKLSILSINTWGGLFSQPLEMGHQNYPVPAALANFSILACTVGGTSQTFWPPRGGGVGGVHQRKSIIKQ